MTRAGLPPTPISSTDIAGKDDVYPVSQDTSFTLPPPAMSTAAGNRRSISLVNSPSDPSNHPLSPTQMENAVTNQNNKTLSNYQPRQTGSTSNISLPPPPTRSRKIIQMKPRTQQDQLSKETSIQSISRSSGKKSATSQISVVTGGNKKQPSSTSVVGRKIARKTAHSMIERRRRSKMNEEFGVLKDMIPACKDQEMHKLAILQASIDYLQYLEQCVTDLKTNKPSRSMSSHSQVHTLAARPCDSASEGENENENDNGDDAEGEENQDTEMKDCANTTLSTVASVNHLAYSPDRKSLSSSPTFEHHDQALSSMTPVSSSHSVASPAFESQNAHNRYKDIHQRHQPQQDYPTPHLHSRPQSATTSPVLLPEASSNSDPDREATAALLMLNTDRRDKSRVLGSGRAMSVKDLLIA